MPEDLIRFYWDADILLSYVNGTPERLPDIDAFLEGSGKEFQLITSAITVVEVAFGKAEQDGKMLDPETERKIDALWAPSSPIRLVEFYPLIAQAAKQLLRQSILRGWSLKPMDAIHMATASQEGAKEFHTYDKRLPRYAADLGLEIREPLSKQIPIPFQAPVSDKSARAEKP